MKEPQILERLQADNLLSPEEYQKLSHRFTSKLFSVHWELKIILYLGVMLLSTGLGILIYLNIDTIGHTAIVSIIGLASLACFAYAYRQRKPFTWLETISDHPFADYILLLGCLLFLTLEGYLQIQYNVFGNRYGLATLIPSILFFFIAYRFDHKGILSMAVTGLAGWLGLALTPIDFWDQDFGSNRLIHTGIVFGAVLAALSHFIVAKNLKKHFSFTYFNFGMQLLFVCALSAMFTTDDPFKTMYFILLAVLCFVAFWYARKEQSFYFLLLAAVYGYVGVTYLFVLLIDSMSSNIGDEIIFLSLLYFIFSCIGIILFFFKYKKILRS
jgi:hypothetical protein